MNTSVSILVFLLCIGSILSRPKDADPAKKRVHEDENLSEIDHGLGEDADAEHNPDYDHEAFLGKDEAKSFDQLTPEESKERLRELVNKIDKDENGEVSEEELRNWIDYTQKRYIYEDVDRQWKQHKRASGDKMTWEEYVNATYGQLEKDLEARTDYDYKSLLTRDKRRWEYADQNKDGALTRMEYANYLHPEEVEHMKEVVVLETLEDIDKDKDGFLTLEEYIGDMYPSEDRENGEDEPEWVKTEREQFGEYRDKNKDGKMDRDEVKDWIMPENYDHIEAETKHLMYEADEDKSGSLTVKEILDKYDLFVGSQATDFGEALVRRHDEF